MDQFFTSLTFIFISSLGFMVTELNGFRAIVTWNLKEGSNM